MTLLKLLALLAAHALQPVSAALPDAIGVLGGSYTSDFPASRSFACGTVAIAGTPSPSIAVAGADCSPFEPLQGILLYNFRVSGPDDLQVPVVVTSHYAYVADGLAAAGASASVAGTTFLNGACYGGNPHECGAFDATVTLMLTTNRAYGVSMQASVNNSLGAGHATAFVDPVFTFDPSFLFASDYTFEFSSGIGNGLTVTPIPEPEIASLMALGLGVLAGIGRHRSRDAGSSRRRDPS